MVVMIVKMMMVGWMFQSPGEIYVTYEIPYESVAKCERMSRKTEKSRGKKQENGYTVISTECVTVEEISWDR